MGASVVCWCKCSDCRSLFLLCPLNAARPTLCLVACLAVDALLGWVSYAIASIMLSGIASASSLFPAVLGYMVKALALKALRY